MHPAGRAFVLVLLLVVGLAACGGDDGATTHADAAVDTPVDTAINSGCNYDEQRDATNDDVSPGTGTPEDTGVTHGSRTVVCGTFDHTHFDGDITVDVDGYLVSFANPADLLVRIHGTGAEAIELVGVDIYGGAQFDQLVGSITFYGDHGVTAVHLPAGIYELAAFALHSEAITASVPYKLEIVTDMPATRCPALTSGGYAEANDGGSNNGNDMVTIPSGAPPALTASTGDQPEATLLTLAPQTPERVSGTAADITAPDQYEDKDTFAFTTGTSTNELAVRLDWPAGTSNLDYLVFEAMDPSPVVRAITAGNTAPEVKTFSVKPSTSYWLLVGAKTGSAVPVDYSASLCGASFTP